MKLVERDEVLRLGEYETLRPQFRARVIEEKKERRFAIGPRMSAVFETHDSVLLQIQEMLRTERITREAAVLHEIETYNTLVPRDGELSITVLVEIDDKVEREAFLVAAKGLEAAFYVEANGERASGATTPDRLLEDRASAVIYLKFSLPAALAKRLRSRELTSLKVGVDHPAYRAEATLTGAILSALADDLIEPS